MGHGLQCRGSSTDTAPNHFLICLHGIQLLWTHFILSSTPLKNSRGNQSILPGLLFTTRRLKSCLEEKSQRRLVFFLKSKTQCLGSACSKANSCFVSSPRAASNCTGVTGCAAAGVTGAGAILLPSAKHKGLVKAISKCQKKALPICA